jgi:hypothetical protein
LFLEYDDAALQLRAPAVPLALIKNIVAGVVVNAGMQRLSDVLRVPSNTAFRGGPEQLVAAHHALVQLNWVRPQAGMPDVGRFWEVRSATCAVTWSTPFNAN